MSGDGGLTATRQTLHILGEHVLAAAREQAVGRIGLEVVAGGIATPPFGDEPTSLAVIGGELVVRTGADERRAPVTTLRAAGDFAGITPGASGAVYTATTPCDLDAPLHLDRAAFDRIAAWYELVDAALREFSSAVEQDGPSAITLWPEHFDVAIRVGEVNYGGVAGDGDIAEPYLYVGPPTEHLSDSDDELWNQPFGASRTWAEITSVAAAVAFFQLGRTAARRLQQA